MSDKKNTIKQSPRRGISSQRERDNDFLSEAPIHERGNSSGEQSIPDSSSLSDKNSASPARSSSVRSSVFWVTIIFAVILAVGFLSEAFFVTGFIVFRFLYLLAPLLFMSLALFVIYRFFWVENSVNQVSDEKTPFLVDTLLGEVLNENSRFLKLVEQFPPLAKYPGIADNFDKMVGSARKINERYYFFYRTFSDDRGRVEGQLSQLESDLSNILDREKTVNDELIELCMGDLAEDDLGELLINMDAWIETFEKIKIK